MVFRDVVLVDIDHTITNAYWRDDLIQAASIEDRWDEYHRQSVHDKPNADIATLINVLHSAQFKVIGLTARPERFRSITARWMLDKGINLSLILMRPDDNRWDSPVVKLHLCREFFKEQFPDCVFALIDDREDVCAAFAALGITTLNCIARRS